MKNFCLGLVLLLSLEYVQLEHIHRFDRDLFLNAHQDNEWDVLVYSQNWPVSMCRVWSHHHIHKCKNFNETWHVHGLWPTKYGTVGPEKCNDTWLFDPDKIKSIEEELEMNWPNLQSDTSLYSFWIHEWTKHGTCAASIEPLNSELKYFSQGLEWHKKIPLILILRDAGIVPSDETGYKILDLYYAVKNKTNVNPSIQCIYDKGTQVLSELRVCFSKSLELVDCDGIVSPHHVIDGVNVLTNCNPALDVMYPNSVNPPAMVLVQLYKLSSLLQWLTL